MKITVYIDGQDCIFEIADINKKTLNEMIGRSAYDRSIFLSLVVKQPKLMANEWYTQVPVNIIDGIVESIINYSNDIHVRGELSKTIRSVAKKYDCECVSEIVKYDIDKIYPQYTYTLRSLVNDGQTQQNYENIICDVKQYSRKHYMIDFFYNSNIVLE